MIITIIIMVYVNESLRKSNIIKENIFVWRNYKLRPNRQIIIEKSNTHTNTEIHKYTNQPMKSILNPSIIYSGIINNK